MKIECVFLDIKDTLGYVDKPANLVSFKPSTLILLKAIKYDIGARIGLITNLPSNVSSSQGLEMLKKSDLGNDANILDFINEEAIIINHDAGTDKPRHEIYQYAAEKVGVPIEKCLFIGENLIEVIGAEAAGMNAILKPFPLGREFKLKPIMAQPASPTDSGRLAEVLMEEEHLIGKRIVIASVHLLESLKKEDHNKHLPTMSILCYLTKHFVDRFHHKKEEDILFPLAAAQGLPKEVYEFALDDHGQGRIYFDGMEKALVRLKKGENSAVRDFCLCLEGFIELYKEHGAREDDELLPELGPYLKDIDDAIILDLFDKAGPGDLTPWLAMISSMESALNIKP